MQTFFRSQVRSDEGDLRYGTPLIFPNSKLIECAKLRIHCFNPFRQLATDLERLMLVQAFSRAARHGQSLLFPDARASCPSDVRRRRGKNQDSFILWFGRRIRFAIDSRRRPSLVSANAVLRGHATQSSSTHAAPSPSFPLPLPHKMSPEKRLWESE